MVILIDAERTRSYSLYTLKKLLMDTMDAR